MHVQYTSGTNLSASTVLPIDSVVELVKDFMNLIKSDAIWVGRVISSRNSRLSK